ncbi:hypothetical protein ACM26W_18595 [Halomonas sp. HK25]
MNRNVILTCAVTCAADDLLVKLLNLVQKYWPEAEGLEGGI